MKVSFAIAEHDASTPNISQDVGFFYAFGGRESTGSSPPKLSYSSLFEDGGEDILVAMNYTQESMVKSPVGESATGGKAFSRITVYKREIWNEEGEGTGETIYHPVVVNSQSIRVIDYNISNKRDYEYIAYPSTEGESSANVGELPEVARYVSVNWDFWSLTELHPVNGSTTQFTASPTDVWLFKYNVDSGEQTQNFSKSQIDNLTAYPTFVHSPKNNLSGSVTALLGSEMVSFELASKKYVLLTESNGSQKGKNLWVPTEAIHTGGYVERLRYTPRLTSNEKIDMLKAWREVAYSGNPKLLKDMKGQSFLVQITASSNTPNYSWNKMPDSISFSWTEIGSMDGVTITNPEAVDN